MMGSQTREHAEGMKRLLDLHGLPLAALVCALTACDAPEKFIGEDSDGSSGTSDTSGSSGGSSGSGAGGSSSSSSGRGYASSSSTGGSYSSSSSYSGTSLGTWGSDGSSTGGGAVLPDGFEDTLSPDGCGDMVVYARTPADDIALVMTLAEGLVNAASTSGETYDGTYDVGDFATFEVQVGATVSFPICNDVGSKETSIDQTWLATAGSVHVIIEPVADAPPSGVLGYATLELSGVEVTYDGVTETLDDMVFADVAVGWLPG